MCEGGCTLRLPMSTVAGRETARQRDRYRQAYRLGQQKAMDSRVNSSSSTGGCASGCVPASFFIVSCSTLRPDIRYLRRRWRRDISNNFQAVETTDCEHSIGSLRFCRGNSHRDIITRTDKRRDLLDFREPDKQATERQTETETGRERYRETEMCALGYVVSTDHLKFKVWVIGKGRKRRRRI